MVTSRRYIHEDMGEADLWIDLSILKFLREEVLLGNLDYVSLRESHKQGLFSSEIDCSWERFRRRALYQVGLGFTEPRIIYGPEGEHIDSKKHTGHLCSMRITPFGFMQIEALEKEVKKYEGFNRYITKIKIFNDKIIGMKGGVIISITTFLVICIFTFDIKVSEMIQKIPILSSVIDTKILKEFEEINERDEFYQAMMNNKGSSTGGLIEKPTSNGTNLSIPSSIIEIIQNPLIKDVEIPKATEDILPKNMKIESMSVKNISPREKLFKITLDDGNIRYIEVKKEGEKYIIVGK